MGTSLPRSPHEGTETHSKYVNACRYAAALLLQDTASMLRLRVVAQRYGKCAKPLPQPFAVLEHCRHAQTYACGETGMHDHWWQCWPTARLPTGINSMPTYACTGTQYACKYVSPDYLKVVLGQGTHVNRRVQTTGHRNTASMQTILPNRTEVRQACKQVCPGCQWKHKGMATC